MSSIFRVCFVSIVFALAFSAGLSNASAGEAHPQVRAQVLWDSKSLVVLELANKSNALVSVDPRWSYGEETVFALSPVGFDSYRKVLEELPTDRSVPSIISESGWVPAGTTGLFFIKLGEKSASNEPKKLSGRIRIFGESQISRVQFTPMLRNPEVAFPQSEARQICSDGLPGSQAWSGKHLERLGAKSWNRTNIRSCKAMIRKSGFYRLVPDETGIGTVNSVSGYQWVTH